jgi:hypothetical protein
MRYDSSRHADRRSTFPARQRWHPDSRNPILQAGLARRANRRDRIDPGATAGRAFLAWPARAPIACARPPMDNWACDGTWRNYGGAMVAQSCRASPAARRALSEPGLLPPRPHPTCESKLEVMLREVYLAMRRRAFRGDADGLNRGIASMSCPIRKG